VTSPVGGTAVGGIRDERARSSRVVARIGLLGFALLAYVPLLLTDIGKVDADSKAYFYIDPGRLLASAVSMWDPKVAMGTVSYQILGFLFPVGPFYWIGEHLVGLPPWVTERLWLGTLVLAAGLGTRYLFRSLGMRGPGIAVGMLAYAFSPYVLQFSSRQSVLLAPWAGMPWMAAFAVLALRRGGWKYPALLAITVQLAGSVNASALGLALLAPALWIPFAVVVVRECDWRRAWNFVWRSGLLIVLTSLWWITALSIESSYGRNTLRFTEQLSTTSSTSSPIEILRGLGYWIFYYRDAKGLIVGAGAMFMRNPAVLFASILIPALALLAAAGVRWSYRAYFVLLVLVGVTLAVGSYPYGGSSPLGSAFKSFAAASTAGFALRNAARAVPLVALGLAALLAAGVSSVHQRLEEHGRARVGIVAAALVGLLCLINAPGIWGGSYYSPSLEYRAIPTYWKQVASSLDAKSHQTRVLALPGSPFATYTWGAVEDPVLPGLMTRPFVTIEEIPKGSDATANLLAAVDEPLQSGLLDPNALAPVARLMSVGDLLLQMDLQTDRSGLIPASALWNTFTARPPAGLGAPEKFGKKIPGPPIVELGDIARPPSAAPPPLAVLPVEQPLNIVRAKSAADPLVIDGDGQGLVDLSSAGLLDADRLVLYSATFARDATTLRHLPRGADLIVTDSNRKQPYWATSLTNSYGPTEQAGEQPLVKSPYDQPLNVFPGATSDAQTVTILGGVKSVEATQGNQVFNPTSTRPSLVLDGSVYTGWMVDQGARVGPERLRIQFNAPITTDHLNIVQRLKAADDGRWISGVTLRFDGHHDVREDLADSSRIPSGQTLRFPKRTFSTLEIQIDRVHHTKATTANAVGFSEIRVADDTPGAKAVRMGEATWMPIDLLGALGHASLEHPLTIAISRDAMDDSSMNRDFWLPTTRSFTLSGTAELGLHASDAQLDHLLGIPDTAAGGVVATSSGRYDDPVARASSAIDGDPSTAWTTPLGTASGWLQVTVPRTISFDHLDLAFVDDGRHSVPTKLLIESNDGSSRVLSLAGLPHTRGPDGTVSVPVRFDSLSGRQFKFSIAGFDPTVIDTAENPSGVLMPSGIAELGIPGVKRAQVPATMPSRCFNKLVTVDGKPFPVRVSGSTADALNSQSLRIQPCKLRDTLTLSGGVHEIDGAESPDSPIGLDVEHLVLASAPGGAATTPTPTPATSGDVPSSPGAPSLRITRQTNASITLKAEPASKPYWLVLGESLNRGWVAKADGVNLGQSTLVDGYANGWLVHPKASGQPMTITLDWTPQRDVPVALIVSSLALLACVGIAGAALFADRRRKFVALARTAPPSLRRTLLPRPLEPRRRAVAVAVVTMTAMTALLVAPWVAPIVGVLVLVAILRPRWRRGLRLAPALIVGATAIGVTATQTLRNYGAVFQWPGYFNLASIPVWVALVLVAADELISLLWRTDLEDEEAG
jgi:arabinofuranan 3-O-arabinosyltransferase